MARWDDKTAKCPFFKTNEGKNIVCEGLSKDTKTMVCFNQARLKAEYKDKHCDSIKHYPDCAIAKMLMGKYEKNDKV